MTLSVAVSRTACVVACLLSLPCGISDASAQPQIDGSVLYRFGLGYHPPTALTPGPDGNLYGLSLQDVNMGGAIVRTSSDTSRDPITFTVVHQFTGPEGATPIDRLVGGPDGLLYGLTAAGGANGLGTFFRLEADDSLTVLHSFSNEEVGPGGPKTALVLAGGAFYGVDEFDRFGGPGAIYRLDPSGAFSIAAYFNGLNGSYPSARMTLGPDGALYGVTQSGTDPSLSNGTVFRHVPGSGSITVVHRFPSEGRTVPRGPLMVAGDGNLYGTTSEILGMDGPPTELTTIYQLVPGGAYTTLHTFAGNDGRQLRTALIEGTDGNLYGTASGGEFNRGTAFRISKTGVFELLHTFGPRDPMLSGLIMQLPEDRLNGLILQQPDGRFLGAARGELFRLGTDGTLARALRAVPVMGITGTDTKLVEFQDRITGAGTGGVHGYGALFRRETNGDITTLHSFSFADGANPSSLVVGADGNLYGTTSTGGTASCGTVFRMTPANVLTTLHHFPCDTGGEQPGGLMRARDGTIYGVTAGAITSVNQVLFRLDSSGTVIGHAVFPTANGASIDQVLAEGGDGRLYVAQLRGGAGRFGRILAIDGSGAAATFYEFTGGSDGRFPRHLTRGAGNAFYGVTAIGANGVNADAFRITDDGTFTSLHQFVANAGARPLFPSTFAVDGYLYGTLNAAPSSGAASFFRISPSGTFEQMASFGFNTSGSNQLFQGSDGVLYGAANVVGAPSFLYSLSVFTSTALSAGPASGMCGGTTTLTATLSAAAGPLRGQTIAFVLNGVAVGTAVTNATGTATLAGVSLAGMGAGVYSTAIEATFAAAGAFLASSAPAAALTVGACSTNTALAASAPTMGLLEPVTFTATVTVNAGGAGQPSGSVEFRDGAIVLGVSPLNGTAAVLTVNGLASGTHVITAIYAGGANFATSTSAPVTVTVRSAAVSTFTIAATGGPVSAGTRPTIAAAVVPLGGGTATGSVQFFDASVGLIGTASLVNGVATIQPAGLAVGVHIIVARYSGNTVLSPSTASPVILTVYSGAVPMATTVALTATPSPAPIGQPVTFTATITPTSGVPTGLVVFLSDGVLLGTATVSSVGAVHTATLTTSALSRGAHVVSALYFAGPGFASSSSVPAVQVIQ